MGRLIDADKLYESLIENISWLKEQDYETYCAVGDTIRFVTDQQPTAYEPDKVVKQLEAISDKIQLQYEYNYEKGMSDGIYDAIEIVKGGRIE